MISTQGGGAAAEGKERWLLLVHQIPPKPDYFRVKVRRRLTQLGAVALKSTVYVLPNTEETLEDFQWLRREIAGEGGEAIICQASFVEGITNAELQRMFRRERDADYAAISAAARAAQSRLGRRKLAAAERAKVETVIARLRHRVREIAEIDFFEGNGRVSAEAAIASLAERLSGGAAQRKATKRRLDRVAPGRVWVTRSDVFVDRIASAWLIRAFIDARAELKFVSGASYRPASGELRFDMFEGEYTHVGDRCTFEILIERFGLHGDAALGAIAEIVHDIDIKDAKFARPEASGIEQLLTGIVRNTPADADRVAQGGALFSALYESFRGSKTRDRNARHR